MEKATGCNNGNKELKMSDPNGDVGTSEISSIEKEVKDEILKENRKLWAKQVKEKLKTIESAEKILANAKRDYEELKLKMRVAGLS